MKQTNWFVFTGAPCSGKTTVLRELQRRDYRVVDEVARALIEEGLKNRRSLKQIKANPPGFEHTILRRKFKVESMLPTEETIILDRAAPDSIACFIFNQFWIFQCDVSRKNPPSAEF